MEAVLLRTGSYPALDAVVSPRITSSLSIQDRYGSGEFNYLKFSTRLKLSDRRSDGSKIIRRAMSETDMMYGFEASGRFWSGSGSRSARIEELWGGSEAGAMIGDGGKGRVDEDDDEEVGVPGGGIGKGKVLGGGGGDRFGSGDGDRSSKLDVYYKQMLKLNPMDPLLLRNYAMFLHEVMKDTARADEYYGRAILANPGDGEVLGSYAKFIWETQKDYERATSYFDQAVHASPENSIVMGMYAEFMWENKEDEDEEEEEEDMNEMKMNEASPISSAATLATITAY
ncbi:unnamed protein product [Rhodiola kirilowii]